MLNNQFLLPFFKNLLYYSSLVFGAYFFLKFLDTLDPMASLYIMMACFAGFLAYGATELQVKRDSILKNED